MSDDVPTIDVLTLELSALAHGPRRCRLVALGRTAVSGGPLARNAEAAIDGLAAGDAYHRRLALAAAWGSRDPAAAARALSDPSRATRGQARALAAALCDDAALVAALEAAPARERKALLVHMRRRRRGGAADSYLLGLLARRDPALGALLAFGSPALIDGHLAACAGAQALDWRALARAHPVPVAALLRNAVAAAPEVDARLLDRVCAALPELGERLPDAAVDLARALVPAVPPNALPLRALARHRPDAVAALCLDAAELLPLCFGGMQVRRLEPATLRALLARFGGVGGVGERRGAAALWLRRVAPPERGALFALAGGGWRDASGAVALAVLSLLPAPIRHAEGRRHLALPELATRPLQHLPYAALLPWDEARAALGPALGDPDPALRGVALAALVGVLRFDRARVPEVLALAEERRNEQDPVRQSLLGALAALPTMLWDASHLPGLGAAFRRALDAADLSSGTASAVERLVVAQLPRHPAWAAGWLATLARERGTLGLRAMAHDLSDADIRRFAPAVMPVLEEWHQREREGAILAFAIRVGRRLRAWDSLAGLLEGLLRQTRSSSAAGTALALIARHRPDRLRALVPALLDEDPSWILAPPVHEELHRRRQDLLAPFLGRLPVAGRFATGRTAPVLPFRSGFLRWTPEQQGTFAATLAAVVADAARDSPAALSAIDQLAALPDVAVAPLAALARADNPRHNLRDAALRGLARRDAGDGLPTLLGALDDGRAAVAAYALGRALRALPPGRALMVLGKVPMRRVTVAKEAVRLIGAVPGEAAFQRLAALAATPLHRDVRVALHRALWERLDRDEAWLILEEAAASPDPAVGAHLARVPDAGLSDEGAERLARLLATLLDHPEPRVRLAALRRAAEAPLADRGEALAAPLLDALASPFPDEARAGAVAVFSTYAGRRAAQVGEAARGLLDHAPAMAAIAGELTRWAAFLPERRQATVLAIIDALDERPGLAALAAETAAATLSPGVLVVRLRATAARLHGDAVARAAAALEAARGRSPEALETIEAGLAGAEDERLRRIALSALRAQAATARGWSDGRVARLRSFRADPSPLVAEAARFTFVPDEVPAPPRRRPHPRRSTSQPHDS